MKRLPPIRNKLHVEKSNVIKFKFNHTAKFIYKIKCDHLQTKALSRSPLWLQSRYAVQKCVSIWWDSYFLNKHCVLKGKFLLNWDFNIQHSTQREKRENFTEDPNWIEKKYYLIEVKYWRLTLKKSICTPGMMRILQKHHCFSNDKLYISMLLLIK